MANLSGRKLNNKWNIGASHALYRAKGNWYHHLTRFPGALCNSNGYVLFQTKEQYRNCPDLQIGNTVHVPRGIASLPSYVKME